MSFVRSIVSRLDAEIDQIQLLQIDEQSRNGDFNDAHRQDNIDVTISYKNLNELKSVARQLSTSSPHVAQTPSNVLRSLKKARNLQGDVTHGTAHLRWTYEEDALWLVAAKAGLQSFGLGLAALLDRVSILNSEISYWNGVLGSDRHIALYTFQTSPIRLWRDVRRLYSGFRSSTTRSQDISGHDSSAVSGWNMFYESVQRVIAPNLKHNARAIIYTPFMLCRSEAVSRLRSLKVAKKITASGIGLLLEEFFSFGDTLPGEREKQKLSPSEWHHNIFKSVVLLDAVFQTLTSSSDSVTDFEEDVFLSVEKAVQSSTNDSTDNRQHDPSPVIERLIVFLETRLPEQETSLQSNLKRIGRPAWVVRYWLPIVLSTFSIGTVSRIFTSNKVAIMTWFRELGLTIIDFWANWVVGPTEKLIGTIRHDEKSEIAIMSRNSLVADRASLERMVFDFVRDHTEADTASKNIDFDAIVADVREGDLTPVLKAYERDLRRPFMGTVRGDLVRALLIQIQKTKVDVEVAIGGINSLLKSQELVFGFVGLTPGILVSYAATRWMIAFFTNKNGLMKGRERHGLRRTIRNVDRILNHAASRNSGQLSYGDHGLFIWEIQRLGELSNTCLPESVLRDFKEDVTELSNVGYGVDQQLRALSRIQWVYSKWM